MEEGELAEIRERWSQTRQQLKSNHQDIWARGLSAITQRKDGNLHASLPDAEFAARHIGSELKSDGFDRIFIKDSERIVAL